MKKILCTILGGLLFFSVLCAKENQERKKNRKAQEADLVGPDTPHGWETSFPRAKWRATNGKKHRSLFLFFTDTTDRKWCKKMYQDVLKDSRFRSLAAQKLTLVYLNYSPKVKNPKPLEKQNKELREKFAPGCLFPTIVVMSPNEHVLGKINGYRPAREFMKELEGILPKEEK